MKHLKLFFALFAMLALGVGNAWGAALGSGYEKVTNISTLSAGDRVVLYADDISKGVTGWNGNKDATVAESGWVEYLVEAASGGVYLKDETADKYITSPGSDNVFKYGTKAVCSVNASGVITCGSKYLYNQTTYFRMYADKSSDSKYKPFYVYKVVTTGGGETPDPTTYTIKWHTAKGVTTDVTLNEGTTITKPATDPTMSGYKFMGWTEDCEVASDGAGFTAIENFGTATEDKAYYAVFAIATTTGGGAATETTASVVIKDYASAKNWANGTKYTTVEVDANITATVTGGSNTGKYYNTSEYEWRLYQTESAKLTISAKNDLNIKTVKVTYNVSSSGVLKLNSTNVTSGTVKDVNASSITFSVGNSGSATNGQVKVTAMEVVYTSGGGGTTTYDNYITTCASGIEYVELGDAFKWSATEAEVTIDATDNVFPKLKNTHNVPVTYSCSDETIATIVDGAVTLKKEGTVTITAKYAGGTSAGDGKEYKATSVTYSLKVNKAVAQPTGTMYVKVTDAVTDGEYLIVYEDAEGNPKAPVAFDGSLTALDAAGNMMSVTITDNVINGNTEIDEVTFTISAMTGGYAIKSKSGKYIGRTSSGNGMNTGASKILNIITITDGKTTISGSGDGASTSLQYYSVSGSERFRYYGSNQKPIALYKKVDPSEILAPAFSVAAGSFYDAQSVVITCATPGAEIYYTLDESTPSSTSTKYTSAVAISETKTLKAIAIKGEYSSSVTEATYTILDPLSTMDAIFAKATEIGKDATESVKISFNNWVISGVVPGKDGKPSSNAYITDGSKGFIIYNKDGHGFNVGNKLSGTVVCDLTRYNGSAEVVGLTSSTEGLTVTTDGDVTPVEVADKSTLSGVNTGAVIQITGVCDKKTIDEKTYYYVGGVQLYGSLFAYENPTVGKKYNVTGVYVQYNEIPEILPRSAEDIEEVVGLPTATIEVSNITMEVGQEKAIEATITPDAAQTTVQYAITAGSEYITLDGTTITAVAAGEATITATIAEVAGVYNGATKTFNVTVKPQNIAILPFEFTGVKADIETTLGMSQEGLGSDYTTAGVTTKLKFDDTGDWVIIHFNGQAEKLAYEIKGNGFSGGKFTVQQSADGSAYTDVFTYTELGDAATKEHELAAESRYVKFIYTEKSSGNVGLGNITISKADLRQETGLAWNPATVSLTVDDAFTAPTFNNPNGLSGITFASSNEELATVNNAGEITLVSGKTGTATITATFADGHADYKPAEATCVITVSPKSEKVVILAQYNGQWYALKAAYLSGKTDRLDAILVNYVGGKLYNVAEADKASIEWSSVVEGDKVSFINDGKYLKGKTTTTLLFEENADGLYQWDNTTYTMTIGTTVRSFLYNGEAFRNFAVSNAGKVVNDVLYSSLPVVTAPVYETGEVPFEITTTAENGTAKGGGVYKAGDKVTLTADPALDFTFVNWTKGSEVVSTANPFVFEATENLELVANFAEISQTSNTLTGEFSVGQYEVAQFATGNLQYTNGTWGFAKQQYQYVGEANINVGDPTFTGTIDMFGWSTNDADNNYGVNPNNVNDLYDGNFVDWGTIAELGEGWSTLSADQWKYLLNTRTNAKNLKQIARVGSVVGIMLFPDNWNETPVVDAEYDSYYELYMYNYSITQWTTLETKGALFLPAAGRRAGGYGNMINKNQVEETNSANLNGGHYKHQDNTNIYCYYWTSTINESKDVSYLHNIQALGGDKYTIGTGAVWGEKGRYGQSVRLAKVTSTLVEIGDSGNTSVIAANDGKEVDVQVNRTFTADKLHTLCLPFDAPVEILGVGSKAYQLSGVRSLADGSLVVDVTLCSEMKAGAPYLVIPTNTFALGELIVDNVTMKNVDVTTVNNVVNNGETSVVFQGILDANGQTNGSTHYYIGTNSYLYNGTVDILGLRSMFIITGMPAGMRARVAFGENAATGLDNITNGENTTIKVIENGQLIIIRNGEKFNAQGVRF